MSDKCSFRSIETPVDKEKEKIRKFVGILEEAYITHKDVCIQFPDGKITIAHSAIPEIRMWFVEDN